MNIVGIRNGMVMQRGNDNHCDISFFCDEEITEILCSGGNSPILTKTEKGYNLKGIYAGGPYTLTINKVKFTDIYVGDLWVLAGQSNMQGVGRFPFAKTNDNPKIRAFYMQDFWDIANHPLHLPALAKHKVHAGASFPASPIRAVGPGLSFAKKMYKLTNVPQGLICCAHGGTSLAQWDPDLKSQGPDKSLFAAMYQRFIDNGSNVKGMFWYQGCAETKEQRHKQFTDRMIKLVKAVRDSFNKNIPIVQVQISRSSRTEQDNKNSNIAWTSVREQQRQLENHIENLDTVHTIAYRLDDRIHLSGLSQELLGEDAADSMFCLINGIGYDCLTGIKLQKIQCFKDDYDKELSRIVITFDNIHGSLQAGPRAMGFSLSSDSQYPEFTGIHDAYTDGNRVYLHTDYSFEVLKDMYLWYGFGRDNSCNIVDSKGRSLPGFGPIKLSNYAVRQ